MVQRQVSVVPPDGGWGWIVMLASFLNGVAMFGIMKSAGILYVAIMNHLLVSRTEAAFIPSLAFSISCLLAPLSSSLSIRYSYRSVIFFGGLLSAFGFAISAIFLHSYTLLTISYGVIVGFGCGLIVVPNIVVVHVYFNRHRALASGFSLAGGSIGGLLVPPLIEWLIDNNGLFTTFLAMSAIMLHVCPLALLFRPLHQLKRDHRYDLKDLSDSPDSLLENGKINQMQTVLNNGEFQGDKSHKQSWTKRLLAATNIDPSMFRKKYFYFLAVSLMCYTYTWSGYITLLPDYALHEASETVSASNAALLLSFMCAGDVVFRIISGWLLDRGWIKRQNAFFIFLYASGGLMFGYTFTQSYSGLIASSVFLGIFISGVIILPPVLLNDFLGPKQFPMAFGICAGIDGFIIMFAAPSLAYIREVSGSYKPCFLLMSLLLILPATAWFLDFIIIHCRRTRKTVTVDSELGN